MRNGETGDVDSANHDLESEGLSGIKLSIENGIYLYVDDMPTSFSRGNGTRKEPLIPLGNVHVRDALENAQYLSVRTKELDGLKRTIFIRHNDRVLGVDGKARVQLIRDKEWSDDDLMEEKELIEGILERMREELKDQSDSDRWTLRVVNQE